MPNFNQEMRFPKLISQRQIDLEESWWKERVTLNNYYRWGEAPWSLDYYSFKTTLHGFWWSHHQLQLGPFVIEWTIRKGSMK